MLQLILHECRKRSDLVQIAGRQHGVYVGINAAPGIECAANRDFRAGSLQMRLPERHLIARPVVIRLQQSIDRNDAGQRRTSLVGPVIATRA